MNFRKITLSVFVLSLFFVCDIQLGAIVRQQSRSRKGRFGRRFVHATVEIFNPVTSSTPADYHRKRGDFRVTNLPFNPYRVTVTAKDSRITHRMWMSGRPFHKS